MRSLIVACVLLFGVSVACAEPQEVFKKSFPSIRGDAQHVPHYAPRIYPRTPDMGPGNFYRDYWGNPYRPAPIIRPYSGQPHPHLIPRRRTIPPQWSPWPEHHQNPHGQGGQGKGPLYRYWYGPRGWGFRVGLNFVE